MAGKGPLCSSGNAHLDEHRCFLGKARSVAVHVVFDESSVAVKSCPVQGVAEEWLEKARSIAVPTHNWKTQVSCVRAL